MTVTINIPGVPAPGGSKKGFIIRRANGKMGVSIVDDAKRNGDWKSLCAVCARQQYNGDPLTGPLGVTMVFTLPRPKWHTGKRGLKPSAPKEPTTKPDVLKLARSTEDAMKGILWIDDNQTVRLCLDKRYGDRPGCEMTVTELSN